MSPAPINIVNIKLKQEEEQVKGLKATAEEEQKLPASTKKALETKSLTSLEHLK